jgi:hypothetical protein
MELVALVAALLGVAIGSITLATPLVRRWLHRRDPAAVQRARLARARTERL